MFFSRRFFLFSTLSLPSLIYNKCDKMIQTVDIASKNQSFSDAYLFKKAVKSIYSDHSHLFQALYHFRNKKIIAKEEYILLSPNKLRIKRLWLNIRHYKSWKNLKNRKVAYNILQNNKNFILMSEKLSKKS